MRWVFAVGLTVSVMVVAAPALGGSAEHVEAWSTLDGSGELAQTCPATGSTAVAGYEVADGVVRVLGDDGEVVSDHALPGSGAWPLAGRYAVTDGAEDARGIDRVLVVERDVVRLELLVDRATSVPLSLTSFEADGDVHCTFAFIEWEPGGGTAADQIESVADATSLPEAVGGFALGSTVAGDGFVAGHYGDGVFTFSLTLWDGTFEIEGGGAGPFDQVELGPGRSLLAWPVDAQTLVMIGDLPADLREGVVAQLPEPDVPGFFLRLWRRLFG